MNTLKIASQNLVSLSFVCPDRPASLSNLDMKSNDPIQFPDLEILSCELRGGHTMLLNNVAASWSMPRIKRLTLRCPRDVGREVVNFCQQHGAGLTFFNMVPSYICDSRKDPFTDLGDVLDLCPALEHIIIHPRAVGYLSHPRIKWVDIWETNKKDLSETWQNSRERITQAAFPSLQGVRQLSARLAYLPELPIIFPPGQVLTPSDSYS